MKVNFPLLSLSSAALKWRWFWRKLDLHCTVTFGHGGQPQRTALTLWVFVALHVEFLHASLEFSLSFLISLGLKKWYCTCTLFKWKKTFFPKKKVPRKAALHLFRMAAESNWSSTARIKRKTWLRVFVSFLSCKPWYGSLEIWRKRGAILFCSLYASFPISARNQSQLFYLLVFMQHFQFALQ